MTQTRKCAILPVMVTRLQDSRVEQLAIAHGRIRVRHGYADGHIIASTPTGASWKITADGILIDAGVDFSNYREWSDQEC